MRAGVADIRESLSEFHLFTMIGLRQPCGAFLVVVQGGFVLVFFAVFVFAVA